MSIDSPVIVFGTGRSGTTIFHKMMATHPQLSWLSTLCDRQPRRPALNRLLMSSIRLPLVGELIERRFPPSESYRFWEAYFKGFSRPCRDLRAEDLSERSRRSLIAALTETVSPTRPRLLLKITGWPRLAFLANLFEKAKFIHVVRDGRAVANSLLHVDFWWGWQGPENWRWGPLPIRYREEWEKSNRSFVVLAAIQWKIHMEAVRLAAEALDREDLMEVRYERLCERPIETIREVCRFTGLEWSSEFERCIGRFELRNENEKWKSDLNNDQQRILEASLVDSLNQYGF